jgi:Cof subfamily protein (haloacid dehalogenase superfamily)
LGSVKENFDITMTQSDHGFKMPFTPIKFVAFDIDGTLIHRGQIVEANREAILRASESGVDLVPFTARAFPSALEFVKDLNLNGPMVCCNGAVGYQDMRGREFWHERIPLKLAREIAGFADKQGIELCTTIGFVTYFRKRPGQKLGWWGNDRYVTEANINPLVESPNRILVSGQEDVQSIKSKFEGKFQGKLSFRLAEEVGHSVYLTITTVQATKGNALKRICQLLGYSLQETLAIGDGEADIDMFSVAGVSVAVGGAPNQILRAADHVAPPCDQGAIAWAVDKFVFVT